MMPYIRFQHEFAFRHCNLAETQDEVLHPPEDCRPNELIEHDHCLDCMQPVRQASDELFVVGEDRDPCAGFTSRTFVLCRQDASPPLRTSDIHLCVMHCSSAHKYVILKFQKKFYKLQEVVNIKKQQIKELTYVIAQLRTESELNHKMHYKDMNNAKNEIGKLNIQNNTLT
ncbi:hypothetical protein QTP88_025603 [Uroleucon formosanum]